MQNPSSELATRVWCGVGEGTQIRGTVLRLEDDSVKPRARKSRRNLEGISMGPKLLMPITALSRSGKTEEETYDA